MTQKQKLLRKILSGSNNIAFDDMVTLVEAFGFRLSRANGSHHIFENTTIGEQLNLQNKKGKAKPYQIKQFLQLVEQYNLNLNSTVRKRMKDYHINLFYSDDDECYIADIPDLKFCSALGDSPEEALREILIAKQVWIESANHSGKKIPIPSYRPVIYQLSA